MSRFFCATSIVAILFSSTLASASSSLYRACKDGKGNELKLYSGGTYVDGRQAVVVYDDHALVGTTDKDVVSFKYHKVQVEFVTDSHGKTLSATYINPNFIPEMRKTYSKCSQ